MITSNSTLKTLTETELANLFLFLRKQEVFKYVTGEINYQDCVSNDFIGLFSLLEENNMYDLYYVDGEGGCGGVGLFDFASLKLLLENEVIINSQISRLHLEMSEMENKAWEVKYNCFGKAMRTQIEAINNFDPLLFELATNHFELFKAYVNDGKN